MKCPAYCCSYEHIPLTDEDIRRLGKHFGLDEAEARKKFSKKGDEENPRVLRHKADGAGLTVDPEALHTIASRITTNIRDLEAAVNRLRAGASLLHPNKGTYFVTPELCERLLRDVFGSVGEPGRLRAEDVVEAVATCADLEPRQLIGRSRKRQVTTARHAAMYLVRERTTMTMKEIGRHFGGRDHSTVSAAVQKIARVKQTDEALAALLRRADARF